MALEHVLTVVPVADFGLSADGHQRSIDVELDDHLEGLKVLFGP